MLKQITVRLDMDTYERVRYWAERHEVAPATYVADAVDQAIRWENRDYSLPTAEQQRLNELLEAMAALVGSVESLRATVHDGMRALFDATRGESSLTEV